MKKENSNVDILKEIIIFLALVTVVVAILGFTLYDFVPTKVVIPEIKEYTADSKTTSIIQEIEYSNGGDLTADESTYSLDEDFIDSLKSYSINSSDLAVYGQKNLYNSGNSNPFDYAEENATPQNQDTNSANNDNTNTSNNNISNNSNTTSTPANATTNTSTGTFFESPSSK